MVVFFLILVQMCVSLRSQHHSCVNFHINDRPHGISHFLCGAQGSALAELLLTRFPTQWVPWLLMLHSVFSRWFISFLTSSQDDSRYYSLEHTANSKDCLKNFFCSARCGFPRQTHHSHMTLWLVSVTDQCRQVLLSSLLNGQVFSTTGPKLDS